MAATLCILALMVLAASCLFETFVYLAVRHDSTLVGRRAKDRVLAMGRAARRRRAVLYAAAALVCLVLMVAVGVVAAHAGYGA